MENVCDINKAFYCVNVNILIIKLEYYGFRGNTVNLLSTHLSQKQHVTVNDYESGLLYVNDKVSQGTIWSPISVGEDSCTLFADNTTLVSRFCPSPITDSNYFISKRKICVLPRIKGLKTFSTKLLGIHVDTNLSWILCLRLSSQIFCMWILQHTLRSVYFEIVHSHLTYGITLRGC